MFKIVDKFLIIPKQDFRTYKWFNFGIYLAIGFVTALLLGQSVYVAVAKPTPKLDRFDPDVYPPIDVIHTPPVIARSDEMVNLEFDFACGYSVEIGPCCRPEAALFVSYGAKKDFTSVPLTEEDQDSLRVLTASLPASDDEGQPLHYYLQVHDPEVNLDVRFPVEGTIDVFSTPDFISIDLPTQITPEPGELALTLPWGSGPREVGLLIPEDYPRRLGPSAMDVAKDGRIALLDQVNERVLIFNPVEQSFTSVPMPVPLKGTSDMDVQFDRSGQIAVFDKIGEPVGLSKANVPQLYRLLPDGRVRAVAPVFAKIPSRLTEDLSIVDKMDSKIVAPFGPSGEIRAREAQRQKKPQELLLKYITDFESRFADTKAGIAFEVRSSSPLGPMAHFEKTSQGYVIVFGGDQFRAIWFDPTGKVLKDVSLPNHDLYSEIYLYGQLATDPAGSLYVLGSTENGIEVRLLKAP
jgi:hypothetical protein